MTCKICHNKETNSTSGICWECLTKIIATPNISNEKPEDAVVYRLANGGAGTIKIDGKYYTDK
jgi:hypothetical protein